MTLFQVPITVEQVREIGSKLPTIPPEYLSSIIAFSIIFFLLSLIRMSIKIRVIVGILVAVALVSVNLLPPSISSTVSKVISPLSSLFASITKSLGPMGTLIASGALLLLGLVLGKISGKLLFKKVVKKAGEPTPGMEKALKRLEQQRDHLISQLKHARGDPAAELKVENRINKINERINILKAKLGLPITA